MRKLIVAIAVLGSTVSLPALAQSSVEGRVGKLESEMRAVQRKLFPGGPGTYIEPQITPGEAPVGPPPGTPATGAIVDLSARVSSLESQMATLTGQIEQSQHRLRQLEDSFAAYRQGNRRAARGRGCPGIAARRARRWPRARAAPAHRQASCRDLE